MMILTVSVSMANHVRCKSHQRIIQDCRFNIADLPPASQATSRAPSDEDASVDEDEELPPSIASSSRPVVRWKKGCLKKTEADLEFSGQTTLPSDVMNLDSPIQFFKYFIGDDIFQHIAEQSTLYSVQSRPEHAVKFSPKQIEEFIGVVLYMSLAKMPRTRSYWSSALQFDKVTEVMSVNEFEETKRFIHFNDNSTLDKDDKLYRIRPIIDMVKARFQEIPMERSLCVDEQIVPFKGRSCIKQYNPQKPHKWGYKIYVLSGVSGFSYDLEVYTGKIDNTPRADEVDLGCSSNVVIRLARSIPRNVGHQLYFDNFFNSPKLQVQLAKQGILCLGTVRPNRVPNCTLPSEKEMKSAGRGTYVEKVTKIDDIDMSIVRWMDKKPVNLLSTFAGSEPAGEAKRWSGKEKKEIIIPCPHVVQVYNKHMGGVDLLDSLLGLYRIKLRSKKWYLRIFFHIVDLAVVNAWLLSRRAKKLRGSKEKPTELASFKAEVAECLCKQGRNMQRKRGRPSNNLQQEIEAKKRKGSTAALPCRDVRLDNVGHLPTWKSKRQRCKLPTCQGFTFVQCEKCGVHLCFNRDKNCFKSFHTA